MKKTFKILVIAIIIAMIMPVIRVNATTSRTEEIVESLKESAKSYNGTVTYEDDNIEISWKTRTSETNTVEFSYNENIIEYSSGTFTNYEEANVAQSHILYAIYLVISALRVNGYTDAEIQSFLSKEPNYEINGIEIKQVGELKKYTSEDGTATMEAAPVSIKIDVTKANINTSVDQPVEAKTTTIDDIVEDLQSDSSFTTSKDDEGIVYSENEIYNDESTITISTTFYYDNYHNVFFNCENDVLTYEDGAINDYYEAERAISHQMYAYQILIIALQKNGYTNEQIQEFMSSEDSEFNYELNGIEFKEIGESKKYTSEDETGSYTVAPMSIKIDFVKANLKKADNEATQNEEYKVNSNTNSGDSISFTAPEGIVYSFYIKDRLATTDEELQQIVELLNDPEYTFDKLKEQLNKLIGYGKSAAGNGTLLKLYEIYLYDNGVEIHETTGGFKLKLKMTDDMKGYDSYKLIYIADDGTTEKAIELTKNGDYLEGILPHLSMYALVGSKNENTAADTNTVSENTTANTNTESKINNPKTGDNIAIWISLMLVSVLGIVGTLKLYKKNK